MNIEQITELQKQHELHEMQDMILHGTAWKMEGSYGRAAMANLKSGACYLPDEPCFDYWGNRVPARSELKPGSTGTLENSINFWSDYDDEY